MPSSFALPPDVLTLIGKVIDDIDKAKPEVVIQVEVLEARTDRLRTLGSSLPGQSASIAINPNATTTTGGSTTNLDNNEQNITLDTLRHLNGSDYSVTLPNLFTANAVLTDTYTKIIQNPEIRSVDGQQAKIKNRRPHPDRDGKLPKLGWALEP